VAFEVAQLLGAPLDVVVARKIGAPFQPELGVGAIAEGGITFFDRHALASLGLTEEGLASTVERENAELARRVAQYRGDREPVPVAERTVIVVDDGLATGVTAHAALRSVRARGPARLILAVPVGPPDAADIIGADADEVVVVQSPQRLAAVGQWYEDFTQTSDATVNELLAAGRG
jgi:putative phosphoribosyl transferase